MAVKGAGYLGEVDGGAHAKQTLKEGRKQFFFEKKNQKTFAPWVCGTGGDTHAGTEFFLLLFFAKKRRLFLLPVMTLCAA
jgi:hypothetical protein